MIEQTSSYLSGTHHIFPRSHASQEAVDKFCSGKTLSAKQKKMVGLTNVHARTKQAPRALVLVLFSLEFAHLPCSYCHCQCYYIEPVKKSVSQPFSLGIPKLKVCQRLKKDNPEICEVGRVFVLPAIISPWCRHLCEMFLFSRFPCLLLFKVKNTAKVQKEATAADVTKLRVKQLKAILGDRGVACDGCLEKEDYVKRVLETAHMDL